MITLLTSELNRINQEIKEIQNENKTEDLILNLGLGKKLQEKETLKKVSLMWADEELKWLNEMREAVMNRDKVPGRFPFIDLGIKIVKMEKIKSLMEKAWKS